MIHINRFIDKIKMLESKQTKQLTMSIREAKDLHGDITKLLLVLQTLQTKPPEDGKPGKVEKVEINGGKW